MKNKEKTLYNIVKISPLPGDRYLILEDITYKDIIIPEGYKTNGADIPRILWSLWPPNRSTYLPAVIVHDYLCDLEEYNKADAYFLEILLSLNVPKITVYAFYIGVRIHHKTDFYLNKLFCKVS